MQDKEIAAQNKALKGCSIIIGIFILLFIIAIAMLFLNGCNNPPHTQQPHIERKDTIQQVIVGIKDTLRTPMFDVTLRRFWLLKWVDTHNEYTDLNPEPNTKYLVLGLKYKNTDTESRMIGQGQIIINYNGRDYNFDHAETIMAAGFSTGMEQLNPLTTHTVIFVYKLPKELKGIAYYHPGRTDDRRYISFEIK